jgi:monoamine oxidase
LFVEGFNAADARRISVQALAKDERASARIHGEQSFRLLNGYDSIVEWLRAGLDPQRVTLHCNTMVTALRWQRGRVSAQAQTRTGQSLPDFRARFAVITLPLGVWQATPGSLGAVRFDPELNEKRAAAQRLAMGAVIRIVLCFRERFWERLPSQPGADAAQASFLHAPIGANVAFPIWWTAQPIKAPVLTGWVGGPAAERLSHQTELEILEQALATLDQMLGLPRVELEEKLNAWFVHDWQADPFTRGAYSYVPVGGLTAVEELAKPIEETLFFAGEATYYEGQSGMVHGALATGRRAAAEILRVVDTSARAAA